MVLRMLAYIYIGDILGYARLGAGERERDDTTIWAANELGMGSWDNQT